MIDETLSAGRQSSPDAPSILEVQEVKRRSVSGVLALVSRTFIVQIISFVATKLIGDINSGNKRKAYFINTNGFDQTIIEMATHCFDADDEFQKKLNQILGTKRIKEVVKLIEKNNRNIFVKPQKVGIKLFEKQQLKNQTKQYSSSC